MEENTWKSLKGGVRGQRVAVEDCDTWLIGIRMSVSLSSLLPFHVLGDSCFESCRAEGLELDRFLACRSR